MKAAAIFRTSRMSQTLIGKALAAKARRMVVVETVDAVVIAEAAADVQAEAAAGDVAAADAAAVAAEVTAADMAGTEAEDTNFFLPRIYADSHGYG